MKIQIFSRCQIEELLRLLKITDRLIIKKKQTDYSKFPCMTLICLFSRSMV